MRFFMATVLGVGILDDIMWNDDTIIRRKKKVKKCSNEVAHWMQIATESVAADAGYHYREYHSSYTGRIPWECSFLDVVERSRI
jgi:hypothetical protein